GVATAADNALLRELAERLHHHHLGALRFARGLERDELADFLATVAVDPGRTAQPIGLAPAQLLPAWSHVRIFPLAYEQLALVEEEERAKGGDPAAPAPPPSDAPQLWVGLAQVALALDSAKAGEAAAAEPGAVARAIDARPREQAYDQVIVGYLLQIAEELKTTGGAEAQALRKRISRMLGELRPETLERLLDMGGNLAQRRKFLLDATQGLAVDAVVDLVRAAAHSNRQTVSHSMLRMLSKLAQHAERGPERVRTEADQALREQVQWLITEWNLDDPNPSAYNAILDGVARSNPLFLTNELDAGIEAERLVSMGIEVGVFGEQVQRGFDALLGAGHAAKLIELLERAPAGSPVAEEMWRQVATLDRVHQLLHADRIDFALLERVVMRLGLAAVDPILDALETVSDQKARGRLLESLARIGPDAAAALVERLPGAKTAAQRDVLTLLTRMGELPRGFDPAPYLGHRDAGVRREAIKLMLKDPDARERAIVAGLADPDDRTVLLALGEALEGCPPGAVPLVQVRVDRRDLDAPMRALGVRAVATTRTRETREWLLRFVEAPKRLFGGAKLAAKSPEMLAALTALAVHWNADPSVAPVLALAARSDDAEVRAAIFPRLPR
ncbi:MAG TPA: hypothetical protein VNA89_15420, partial [Gemmatimonadaceae bacterium]|nr:hypothetical protein [Gemmatimonadaceae bacterium]